MHDWPSGPGTKVPSPTLVAAWLTLGALPTERLPMWAAWWIAEGLDGPSLVQLAGLGMRDDPRDIRDVVPGALADCGVAIPSSDQAAAMTAFTALAELQAGGLAAERWIVEKVVEIAARTGYSSGVLGLPLGKLFGLDDEWGACWGRSPAELTQVVREACREQLERAEVRPPRPLP